MTERELRALLGDKDAQRECTEKGILLPCPCCGGTAKLKRDSQVGKLPIADKLLLSVKIVE